MSLGIEKPELFNSLLNMSGVSIELSDDVAIEIGDWIGEKLQKEGFDVNYNLTATGKVLEELEDLFHF